MGKTTTHLWNTGIMFGGLAATVIGSKLGADTATLACTSGLLTYLSGLAGNQAQGWLKEVFEKRPKASAEEVFHNHHIRALLIDTARAVVERVTATVREEHGIASRNLIAAVDTLPDQFAQELETLDSPLASLSDFHAPDLLSRYATAQGHIPLLTQEIWQAFIERHLSLSDTERDALAEGFHSHFGEALWNLVKIDATTDKQGYAAVELLFHSRILKAVEGTRRSIAPIKKRVTKLIRQLDEKQTRHFQALLQGQTEIVAQLNTHSASLHSHVGTVHQTVKKVGKSVKRVEDKLDKALADRPSTLDRYKANLTARFSIHNSIGFSVADDPKQRPRQDRIVDLFVPPTCTKQRISPEQMQADLEQGENQARDLLPRLEKVRSVVLLADPGMGKSTLVQWLVTALAAPVPSKEVACFGKAIPLPIILREMVRDLPTDLKKWSWQTLLETFLHHKYDDHKPGMAAPLAADDTTWRTLLDSPQAWFLLDGLDEIGDPAKRRALRDAIWEGFEAHPGARFLITSRVVGYEEAEVHRVWSGTDKPTPDLTPSSRRLAHHALTKAFTSSSADIVDHYFLPRGEHSVLLAHLFYLAPWDDTQQKDFSQHWFRLRLGESDGTVRARKFVQAVHGHPSTGTIGRVPNLLLLMALLYRHRASLPHGRAKVYTAISEAYLEGIDVARRTQESGHHVHYTRAEKERLLAIIAMHMQMRRAARNDEEDDDAKGEVMASHKDLESWLCPEFGHGDDELNREAMKEFIRHIANRSGLLLPRGMQEGQEQYAFAHLSFQEYYTACWLEREFRRLLNLKAGGDDDLDLLDAAPETVPAGPLALEEADFAHHAANTLWREPLLFLAERLAESPADTQTLRKWLFPIKAGEPLAENAGHLLATLSIDPQVNFPLPHRQQLWTHLWRLQLDREKWWEAGAAPALLEPSEFQAGVFSSLRGVVEKTLETKLSLRGCMAVSDLAPLAGLGSLQELNLTYCVGVSDLAPLASLGNLQWLNLLGCTGVNDLTPLASLGNLQWLNLLGCTGVSDLTPLAGLGSLQSLSLRGCTGVSDLTPLAGLGSLRELDLQICTSIGDITPLASMGSLQKLYLTDCTGLKEAQVRELRERLPGCHVFSAGGNAPGEAS